MTRRVQVIVEKPVEVIKEVEKTVEVIKEVAIPRLPPLT